MREPVTKTAEQPPEGCDQAGERRHGEAPSPPGDGPTSGLATEAGLRQRVTELEHRIGRVLTSIQDIIADIPESKAPGLAREITESRLHQQLLRESAAALRASAEALSDSEHRFQELVENINEMVFTIAVDGAITYVSPVAEPMLGLAPEQVIGRRFSDFIDPADLPRMEEEFSDVLRGILYPSEYRVRTGDGRVMWVRSSSKPVVVDGRVVGLRGTLADITARRQAEDERTRLQAQLLQAQKLESLGLLAGGIAHDFNNLLCGMLGSAELALLDLAPGHPARSSLDHVRQTAWRATELCRQLLAYSGKGRFVTEPVSLSDLVEGMGQMLAVSISKKITLRYDLGRDLPGVEADPTQLRQVVLNLIVNASEAIGDDSGTIRLRTGVEECDAEMLRSAHLDAEPPAGRYVCLEVSDTGPGMCPETRRRLFDPFFSTKFTGRGLGLAATLGIVRGHHGVIKVESELGRGASFKVFLPATDALPRGAASPDAEEKWRGWGLVLLVDDEEIVRIVAGHMLERLGFEVLVAENGLAALKVLQARAGQVRLVVLDMTMPRLNGEETLREIRREWPEMRVLLTSGYSEQEASNRFAGQGLAGFIQKPFHLAGLRRALQTALDP